MNINKSYLNKTIKILDFFSYLYPQKVWGLHNIPLEGPALIVVNHGLLPFHALFLGKTIFQELHRTPCALGADFIFHIPLINKFFTNLNALPANPKNAAFFLQQKKLVMVAPGGVLEGILSKPGRMHLPWEKRTGFVKAAAENYAPIIPVYCDEINDMYWQSDFAMALRIRFNQLTRLPIPLFWGLGLLPLPVLLNIEVGEAIYPKSNSHSEVKRTHHQVLASFYNLQQKAKARRFSK